MEALLLSIAGSVLGTLIRDVFKGKGQDGREEAMDREIGYQVVQHRGQLKGHELDVVVSQVLRELKRLMALEPSVLAVPPQPNLAGRIVSLYPGRKQALANSALETRLGRLNELVEQRRQEIGSNGENDQVEWRRVPAAVPTAAESALNDLDDRIRQRRSE